MAKKIVELVGCCDDCPNKSYYSGGRSMCNAAGTILPHNEGHNIPDWCPLADYPSDAMEKMSEQLATLRQMLSEKAA